MSINFQNSYERATLKSLARLDTDAAARGLRYALFGGAAIAGYIGHLPRRLHDVDLIVPRLEAPEWNLYFRSAGFHEDASVKSRRAGFTKYTQRAEAYSLVYSFFPGRFRLVDIDSPGMPELLVYDFTVAIRNRRRVIIRTLDQRNETSVWTIPPEELLITKLFPTIEPNNIHDVILLLSSLDFGRDASFDRQYFAERLATLGTHADLVRNNAMTICVYFEKSAWQLLTRPAWQEELKQFLGEIPSADRQFLPATAPKPQRTSHAVVVSHGPDCLDGVASAVCIARTYGPDQVQVRFTHPSDVDQDLIDIASSSPFVGDLWITDVTWKHESTDAVLSEMARKGWRIFWADHHANALQRRVAAEHAIPFTLVSVNNAYSAARLTYDLALRVGRDLGRSTKALEEFQTVVLMADDADRWIHSIPGSRELALAVSGMGGLQAYQELLRISPDGTLSSYMEGVLNKTRHDLGKSVGLARNTRFVRHAPEINTDIVGCICRGFVSEVADDLRRDHPNAVFVLYNLTSGRVSLRRSETSLIDCAKLASRFGGGGHPAAAGFDLDDLNETIVRDVVDRVSHALMSREA